MKILVGYNGSKTSKTALELAKKHALAFDAQIHVVASITKTSAVSTDDIKNMEEANRELDDLSDSLFKEEIRVSGGE
jgi:nucleotide-binding universal stress UspA family protein